MKPVVAIGERVNSPSMTDLRVAHWRQKWEANSVSCICNTPAMVHGATKERLFDLTSLRPGEVQIVNILPPDNKCGTWDKDLAELCAVRLLTWMQTVNCPWERIILLGKRVSETLVDRTDVEFGTVYDLVGTPALCYPHPSGRSHYLNENCYRERARDWARDFLRRPT